MADINFINLKQLKIPIIPFSVVTDIPTNLFQLSQPFQPYIHFNDSLIENNFRVLESYLPEILFLIASEKNGEDSINQCIIQLSKRKLLATKENGELEYHHLYQSRVQAIKLLDMLTIKSTEERFEISFL